MVYLSISYMVIIVWHLLSTQLHVLFAKVTGPDSIK